MPFLKAEAGEADAMKRLNLDIRHGITPFFDVPRLTKKETLDQKLEKASKYIIQAMGPIQVLFVDTFDIPLQERCNNGEHPVTVLHNTLISNNLSPVPVYGFDRDEDYLKAILNLPHFQSVGLCLRLDDQDISIPESLPREVLNFCSKINLPPDKLDIIIDHRSVIAKKEDVLLDQSVEAIYALYNDCRYRSITLAGSNYPNDVTPIPVDSIGYLPRKEYKLWKDVSSILGKRVAIRFGDYGVLHPDFTDRESFAHINAKIRYTIEDSWMIARGHSLREPPKSGQYFELAEKVRMSPHYCGPSFSYGDERINLCAHRQSGPGNPRTWVGVDMSHHLHFVTLQVERHIRAMQLPALP
jgi:hypothetical protein